MLTQEGVFTCAKCMQKEHYLFSFYCIICQEIPLAKYSEKNVIFKDTKKINNELKTEGHLTTSKWIFFHSEADSEKDLSKDQDRP